MAGCSKSSRGALPHPTRSMRRHQSLLAVAAEALETANLPQGAAPLGAMAMDSTDQRASPRGCRFWLSGWGPEGGIACSCRGEADTAVHILNCYSLQLQQQKPREHTCSLGGQDIIPGVIWGGGGQQQQQQQQQHSWQAAAAVWPRMPWATASHEIVICFVEQSIIFNQLVSQDRACCSSIMPLSFNRVGRCLHHVGLM
jgi:hypothetical protein